MTKLKNMISRYMQIITLITVVAILAINIWVQILNEQRAARESAARMFRQVEQILEENKKDLTEVEEEYRTNCLNDAETIAYIIQYNPSLLDNIEELKKIAEFVQVDEIHIFDTSGRIFTGTHPEYYNYTFDSGEQMAFFKPMLKDKSLKLCQDITPNTAEGKLMQYSALWSENGEFIVQVGREPVNVMKKTKKNELSYIFSFFRVSAGADMYAIDMKSGEVVGSTTTSEVGKNIEKIGLDLDTVKKRGTGFQAVVNGVDSYCVFTTIGMNYIGRIISMETIYNNILKSIGTLSLFLIIIAITLIAAVTQYMNKSVINGIYNVNEKLRMITNGNLNESVDVRSSVEFYELSTHINDMIKSLLANTEKISYVLSKTNRRIGVYEYNEYMKNVRFTEYVPKIFGFNKERTEEFASNVQLFRDFIAGVRESPISDKEKIYQVYGEKECYVEIEEDIQGRNVFGVVLDVTEEVLERKKIETERDIDVLTGLYNRRGLDNKLLRLFEQPENLGKAALIMLDSDGLKEINDQYGHEKGDVYLSKLAEILDHFGERGSIAARQGGDEFVLFLFDYESDEELFDAIEQLEYYQNNTAVCLNDHLKVPLRFSFGYSLVKEEKDYQSLLKQADERMYKNKCERKLKQ